MPARRKPKRNRKSFKAGKISKKRVSNNKSSGLFRFKFILVFIALVCVSTFLYVHLTKEFWDGKSKLALVIDHANGDISVANFDPEAGEIVNVKIPAETQVEVARQLGTWRIRSIWQLGVNEDLDGQLLAETVTRHFKFPVSAWAASPAEGFVAGKPTSFVSALISPYKTNLSIGDRVFLALFSLGVKGTKRVDINLVESSYLTKKRLTDGEEGYVVSGNIPQKLLVTFSDGQISKAGTKVVIKDASSRPGLAKEVGELVEVLGAKVVAISNQPIDAGDCVISGKEKEITAKFVRLLSCRVGDKRQDTSFDVEIVLGEEFAKRY